MSPLIRYTLLQIPAWLLLALLLWWAVSHDWIPLSIAVAIMAGWILKDAALYPLCKPAFEAAPEHGPKGLIGREAVVVTQLTPCGQVRLDGERWSARTQNDETIADGRKVRVIGTEGLVLLVEIADP